MASIAVSITVVVYGVFSGCTVAETTRSLYRSTPCSAAYHIPIVPFFIRVMEASESSGFPNRQLIPYLPVDFNLTAGVLSLSDCRVPPYWPAFCEVPAAFASSSAPPT